MLILLCTKSQDLKIKIKFGCLAQLLQIRSMAAKYIANRQMLIHLLKKLISSTVWKVICKKPAFNSLDTTNIYTCVDWIISLLGEFSSCSFIKSCYRLCIWVWAGAIITIIWCPTLRTGKGGAREKEVRFSTLFLLKGGQWVKFFKEVEWNGELNWNEVMVKC